MLIWAFCHLLDGKSEWRLIALKQCFWLLVIYHKVIYNTATSS